MRRATLLAVLIAVLAPFAIAGDPEFNTLVRGVESALGVRRTSVPLLGLATFFAKSARPAGVHQFDMAVFEDLNYKQPDSQRVAAIVQRTMGDAWCPLIRITSRQNNEQTYIYVRPDGKNCRVILATFEANEAVLIYMKGDPEMLADALADPGTAGKSLRAQAEN